MSGHTETDFEKAIEHGLTTQGGYTKGDPKAFDEALALFPSHVTGFMRASQPTRWAQHGALLGTKIEAIVVVQKPSTGFVYGTEVAAPAWKQIMNFALSYLKIPPG